MTESALAKWSAPATLETLVTGDRDEIARDTLERCRHAQRLRRRHHGHVDQYLEPRLSAGVQAAVNDTQKATNDSAIAFELAAETYA